MVKRHHLFKSNEIYHIYNRGVDRGRIFFEDENYQYFLQRIERYLLPVMDIYAYCLMPTHYHLLISASGNQTNQNNIKRISKTLQKLSISYTKAINKRFDRVGALFQGAYQAKIINDHTHLKNTIFYIHQNPVDAGLTTNAIDWKYSSARVYEGLAKSGIITILE